MQNAKGIIVMKKVQFKENQFAIGITCLGRMDFKSKEFKQFMSQYVGNPNLNIYKTSKLRDDRYEQGKQLLLNAGYGVQEVSGS